MTIKPFTLIGATTRAGMLTGPLRDRFQMREHLDFYSEEELTQIIKGNAKKLHLEIDDESANIIAIRSRSTPRIANNRLRCVRDYVTARAGGKINPDITRAALLKWEIDTRGLDKMDRKYLETLIGVFRGGPAGVEAIAHTINTASDTLIDEVEPFLLRTGMVVRTPRGRIATQSAFTHMGMSGKPFNIDDESAGDDQDALFA
jgi:Holliday junction DNA helicase RuvB